MIHPLLKWAGGKRQLLPALRTHYPTTFERYIEPFVGSGAVFFDLCNAGRLEGRQARLVDVNADLIGCYRTVRDHTEAVIAALDTLEREHRAHGERCYYEVRDNRFNRLRGPQGSAPQVNTPESCGASLYGSPLVDRYTPELAAMLIYLNRTGFNGLFRLNRNGGFNVPAGRYSNPTICDGEHVRGVARALSAAGVTLECLSFEEVLADARAGDFVYCDPPYAPLSRTASFAHYTAGGFTHRDHDRLRKSVIAAADRGAIVLVSNSSAPEIECTYVSRAARRAGLVVQRVPARRAINSRASARGPVTELIISNSPARGIKLRMAKMQTRTARVRAASR